jgi:hypothetical protein
MDIGSLFILLALLVLVGIFISRPLLERKDIKITSEDIKEEHDHSALLAERDRTLDALEELDFDYAVGKIPEEDYPAQRSALIQRGAYILKELDRYEGTSPQEQAETRLETAIAARRIAVRQDSQAQPASASRSSADTASLTQTAVADDEIEALIAARRRKRSDKSAGFCPQCGNAVTKSDRFCSKCGTTLT